MLLQTAVGITEVPEGELGETERGLKVHDIQIQQRPKNFFDFLTAFIIITVFINTLVFSFFTFNMLLN